MAGFVVELEPGVWLAPWSGDPGRTQRVDNAKVFPTRGVAIRALGKAQRMRPFASAEIIFDPNTEGSDGR